MYIVTIEKRIGRVTDKQFVMTALAIPFEPRVGLAIELPLGVTVTLEDVVWSSSTCIFRATTERFPTNDAEGITNALVKEKKWMIAVKQADLVEARKRLAEEVIRKLKSTILRAQPLLGQLATGGKIQL